MNFELFKVLQIGLTEGRYFKALYYISTPERIQLINEYDALSLNHPKLILKLY